MEDGKAVPAAVPFLPPTYPYFKNGKVIAHQPPLPLTQRVPEPTKED